MPSIKCMSRRRQDGGVEGHEPTILKKTHKSQLVTEQSPPRENNKNNTGTYQERYPTSKDKEEATMRQ